MIDLLRCPAGGPDHSRPRGTDQTGRAQPAARLECRLWFWRGALFSRDSVGTAVTARLSRYQAADPGNGYRPAAPQSRTDGLLPVQQSERPASGLAGVCLCSIRWTLLLASIIQTPGIVCRTRCSRSGTGHRPAADLVPEPRVYIL